MLEVVRSDNYGDFDDSANHNDDETDADEEDNI